MKRAAYLGAPIVLIAAISAYVYWPAGEAPAVATCDSPSSYIVPSTWESWSSDDARSTMVSVPIPSFTSGGQDQIDYLRDGRLFVDKRGPVQELDDVRWADESHGNYYSTQMHGMVGIGGVLEKNKELPSAVEQAVADHIRNWGYCAAHNRSINSRAWYEGTVIKRQSNLLRALEYMDRHGGLGGLERNELLYLIDTNARFLLEAPDIYEFGNHGTRQDMLLAATALALPDHPRAEDMLRLAERRLEEAAVELFTEEGIWKEHAPGYVNYALRIIGEIKALHRVSDKFDPQRFIGRYDTSLSYLLSALLPNGQIPYVGYSGAKHIHSSVELANDLDNLLRGYARSLSAHRDYGHAIVRGDHPDGLYLLFVAGQNLPAGKRHADALTFLLYNFGRAWVTEGGHQSYELSGMTQYLRSPFAHNTYMLNGEFVHELAHPELHVELLEAVELAESIVLKGRSERFTSPASFERTIEVTDYSAVKVRDVLAGDGSWEGRLQLPGDLDVTVQEKVVTARDPDGREMTIRFAADTELGFSTCHGEEDPVCGWGNPAHEFGPATTLIWSFENAAEISFDIVWRRDS